MDLVKHGKEAYLNMGCETIHISKEYGPLIFCDIRITAQYEGCKWVIEREHIDENAEIAWEKVAEIDGQESIFFNEE